MANNNLKIDKLGDGMIAGHETANPIIDWIRGLSSVSEFIDLSPNSYGSVDISLDAAGIIAKAARLVNVSGISGEFKGIVSKNRLTMASGHIYVGDDSYHVGGQSRTLGGNDSGKCWLATITTGGMSVSWGSLPANCVTSSSLILPLCGAIETGGKWVPDQYHLGSWVIPFPPACLISGYDTTKTQSLDHVNGTLVWHNYKKCGSNN